MVKIGSALMKKLATSNAEYNALKKEHDAFEEKNKGIFRINQVAFGGGAAAGAVGGSLLAAKLLRRNNPWLYGAGAGLVTTGGFLAGGVGAEKLSDTIQTRNNPKFVAARKKLWDKTPPEYVDRLMGDKKGRIPRSTLRLKIEGRS